MRSESVLPLSGIRVVALEQAVAGPFASRQFADMGADVIKVERPDGGDPARAYDGVLDGESAYFVWLNRGKRSIVLDLKDDGARESCDSLIATADVVIHNLAPGAVERLGFGYEALASRFPRLIWCGISGYGPNGPQRDRKAYDMLIQAEAGVVGVTGTPDSPAKAGISIADIAAGMYAYSSVLTALLDRGRTGVGDRIDISMLECLTEWMMPPLYVWHGTGAITARAGVRHNMIVPYGAYTCADGAVMLAVQSDREWRRFCSAVLGRAELADDERFASNSARLANRVALEEIVDARFRDRSRAEVSKLLEEADIPTGAVNDVATVAAHPQLLARERWVQVDSPAGAIPALLPPHNLQSAPPRMGRVPALGEHTEAILAELAGVAAAGESNRTPNESSTSLSSLGPRP